tara:strand:+ start:215 stop:664 length:450 start_codon:yes stop_codon:yes gene_type:complete
MDYWNEYDKMKVYLHWRFGYFSTQYLTRSEINKYKQHNIAESFLIQHPECMHEVIPRIHRELLSEETIHLIYCRELNEEHYDILNTYNLSQLKHLVKKNYYLVEHIKNKQLKKSWAKALIETKKWGVNTLALITNLPDELYFFINTFII